ARIIWKNFGCAALIKGGHLQGVSEAVDIFYDGEQELLLSAPFAKDVVCHGTGCTYSAAISAYLALGLHLPQAVSSAKRYITGAIAQSNRIAKHRVLNWRLNLRSRKPGL